MRAAIDTGAFAGSRVPAIRACQIARPKRPVPALAWPDGVNRTGLALIALPQEYAVARMSVFNNSPAQTHTPQEISFQLLDRDIQMPGNEQDFGSFDPDVSLGGSGTTPAALEALKVQPRRIPGNFFITTIHSDYFTTEDDQKFLVFGF
jgi:hypothetical protein